MMWARIEQRGGKKVVMELTDVNPEGRFHESLVWVPVKEATKERDEYDEVTGETSPPLPPTKEETAAWVRADRDRRLAETDWTQAADVPQATKDKWAPYRQALRDVPQQEGFPFNVVWPEKPI